MKKTSILFLMGLLLNVSTFAADSLQIFSIIDAVTVYRSGALVNRKANAQLTKGVTEITLRKLPLGIDMKSFQASVNKGFSILGVTPGTEKETPKSHPEAEAIGRQIKEAELKIKLEKAQMESLKEEETLLMNNRQIASSNTGITGPQLEQVTTYFRTRMTALKTEKVYSEERLNVWQSKRDSLKSRQLQLTGPAAPVTYATVTLKVMAFNTGKLELDISYYMKHAYWVSSFDLRVVDITQAMQIDYKSDITNNTGENWENVKLTLSTGNPIRSNIAPNIQTWWLEYQYYRETQKMRTEDLANMRTPAQSRGGAADEIEAEPISTVSENITATEFKLSERYTLASGAASHMIVLETKEVPAQYSYKLIPKKSNLAYLTASIDNVETLNLSSGKANIYFGQSYVGETMIDLSAATDTLQVSLGADIGIAVSREKIKDRSTKNFFGTKVEETHSWLIKLKNNKPGDIQIKIQDHIPVSKDEEIEVKAEISDNAQLDSETGIISWNLNIRPGESREIRFSYKVRYSKGKTINL